MNPTDEEMNSYYRQLVDEENRRESKAETEIELQQAGTDIEVLRDDFVTHQSIRSFLKDIRRATYAPKDTTTSIEYTHINLNRFIDRTIAIIEQKIDQLLSSGELTLGTFQTQTSVTIYCNDCETEYDITTLLEVGQCDCNHFTED